MERKGFGIRLGAFLIDFVILFVINAILSLIILGSLNVNFSVGTSSDATAIAENAGKIRMVSIIGGLIGLAYWAMEIFRAQSLGKMILGMKIGSVTGAVPADTGSLATRYAVKNAGSILSLLGAITGVGLISLLGGVAALVVFVGCFFALGQNRQALQDMIAKTAVYGPAKSAVPGFQPVMSGQAAPGAYTPPTAPPPQV